MPNDFPFSAFACGASGNSRKQAAVSILASGGTVWTCRAKEVVLNMRRRQYRHRMLYSSRRLSEPQFCYVA